MNIDWSPQVPLFLLAFSSLFPLINPVGAALIIAPYLNGLEKTNRHITAFKIALYCFVLGYITIHAGSYILKFMGIAVETTQFTGGVIIAKLGLGMLEPDQELKEDAEVKMNVSDSVFYPFAFPLTVGPGSIATLIALSAQAHTVQSFETGNVLGITIALLVTLIITYFCFIYASALSRRIGKSGSLVLNRLMAFLLFSIGVQMAFKGFMLMLKSYGY